VKVNGEASGKIPGTGGATIKAKANNLEIQGGESLPTATGSGEVAVTTPKGTTTKANVNFDNLSYGASVKTKSGRGVDVDAGVLRVAPGYTDKNGVHHSVNIGLPKAWSDATGA